MRYWRWLALGFLLTGCAAHPVAPALPTIAPALLPSVPAAPSNGVTIVAIRGAKPGGQAAVTAHATPATQCAITYTMPDGKIGHAPGLNAKTTDAQGSVRWTWVIPSTTAPGIGTIEVVCDGARGAERILIGVVQ